VSARRDTPGAEEVIGETSWLTAPSMSGSSRGFTSLEALRQVADDLRVKVKFVCKDAGAFRAWAAEQRCLG
jgi:heme-degrading monooxygenase HmoA